MDNPNLPTEINFHHGDLVVPKRTTKLQNCYRTEDTSIDWEKLATYNREQTEEATLRIRMSLELYADDRRAEEEGLVNISESDYYQAYVALSKEEAEQRNLEDRIAEYAKDLKWERKEQQRRYEQVMKYCDLPYVIHGVETGNRRKKLRALHKLGDATKAIALFEYRLEIIGLACAREQPVEVDYFLEYHIPADYTLRDIAFLSFEDLQAKGRNIDCRIVALQVLLDSKEKGRMMRVTKLNLYRKEMTREDYLVRVERVMRESTEIDPAIKKLDDKLDELTSSEEEMPAAWIEFTEDVQRKEGTMDTNE